MASWALTETEGRLIEEYRKLEQTHNEFTLTVVGFVRSGKRHIVLEPKPRLYVEDKPPLSLAIDD